MANEAFEKVASTGLVAFGMSPQPHGTKPDCKSLTPLQLALLFSSFIFMSLGAEAMLLGLWRRPAGPSRQPKQRQGPAELLQLVLCSVGISTIIAVTFMIYMIQDNLGWKVGFGVLALSFLLGSPFYLKPKPSQSMFTGLFQAITAAIKKRRLVFPVSDVGGTGMYQYHHTQGSHLVAPTEKLRFLNKACMITNAQRDLTDQGTASDPWRLCRVEQVEDLKAPVKLTPVWSTGIIMAVTISWHSIPVYQARTMDRHLGPKYQLPAGSYGVFAALTATMMVAVYDRILSATVTVMVAARITGNPRGIGRKQPMGIGLLFSCAAAIATAAVVENDRRDTAIRQGLRENGQSVVDMSAMWLVPQHWLIGLVEVFNVIGQTEFYNSELPKTMSSIGVGLLALVVGVGNLVGSLIVEIMDKATQNGGNGR
ncbi:hypothetical protein ACLOJK_040240 [Asimina triloba]